MKKVGVLVVSILAMGICVPAAAQFATGFKPPPAVDAAWFNGRTAPRRPPSDNRVPDGSKLVKPGEYWLDGNTEHFIQAQPVEADPVELAAWQKGVAEKSVWQEPFFRLALAHAQAHRWPEALRLLNDQLKVHYASYPALSLRAAIESALGRDDLASDDLEAALAWEHAWRLKETDWSGWSLHDRQEGYLLAMLASSNARLGRMDSSSNRWGAKGALDRAKRVQAEFSSDEALKAALAKAEAAVAIREAGLEPARVAAIDADLENPPTSCIATANLEQAISMGYRKDAAAGRLVEAYELCYDFAKARALRDAFPSLSAQLPYANSKWEVRCDGQPDVLMRALEAKYDDYHIAQRVAKFYLGCGRPDDASTLVEKAMFAAISPPYGGIEYTYPVAELTKDLAIAYGQLGKAEDASRKMTTYLRYIEVLEEDPTHPKFSAAIDEAIAFSAFLLRSREDGAWNDGLRTSLQHLTKWRVDMAAANSRAEGDRVARCNSIAAGVDALTNSANRTSQSTTVGQYISIWENACTTYRSYIEDAQRDKCGVDLIRQINGVANTAYSNAKTAADNWEKDYLEHYSVGCYAMPQY